MSSAQPYPPEGAAGLLTEAVREIALAAKSPIEQLKALKNGAASLAIPIRHGFIEQADVYDRLIGQAGNVGLLTDVGQSVVETTIEAGIKDGLETPQGEPPPEPPRDGPRPILK